MDKIITINLNIIFLFLSLIFYIKADPLLSLGGEFPIALTLYDDNILLITKTEIIFYDSSLESIINNYNLSGYEIPLYYEETFKTLACQYPQKYNSYILVFIKDQLFFFEKNGDKIWKENFTSTFKEQNYYEIIPIKKVGDYLYYIISMTIKNNPIIIKFYYYKFDIKSKNNFLILEKDYNPLTIINTIPFVSITDNVACVLMNSNQENDILTCFYSGSYPCQISINSFSLENDNITELSLYSKHIIFNNTEYINLFRAKVIGNRSKAYIAFAIYEKAGYSAIYDINSNNLYSIEKRIGTYHIGSLIRCLNLYYFERTEQFVLFFRDNDRTFRIAIMNKEYEAIYNKNAEISIKFDYNLGNVNREAIIYYKKFESYLLLSDAGNNNKGIQAYSINITAEITNYYYDNETNQNIIENLIEEEEKEEEKEEEEEE